MIVALHICSSYEADGSGIDRFGHPWRWEFSRRFGPCFLDASGEPLKEQPNEHSQAWVVFYDWYEAYQKQNPELPRPNTTCCSE